MRGKSCGELTCSLDEYCASDLSCRDCRRICDKSAINAFNEKTCNEQCAEYMINKLNDITRTKMDGQVNTSLALSVTALAIALLAFLCFCALAIRIYVMIKKQNEFSSPLRALFCFKKSATTTAPVPVARPHLTVATVEAAAVAAAEAEQNGSTPSDVRMGGSPGTPGTSMTSLTSRRHPREDSSYNFAAYDNPVLNANNHSNPTTPKHTTTTTTTPTTTRFSPKESSF